MHKLNKSGFKFPSDVCCAVVGLHLADAKSERAQARKSNALAELE